MTKIQLNDLLGDSQKEANFNKKQFDQTNGISLLKLQQAYNDDRFKLTERFQDDINKKKLSKKALLDVDDARYIKQNSNQNQEQLNLLKILGELIPDQKRFIEKEIKQPQNYMIQRFDPNQIKTHQLIKKKDPIKIEKKKIEPQIKKGIDKTKIKVIKGDLNLKKTTVKKIEKVKKINSEGWKQVLQNNESFSLFS